ncbi:hypothetical protein [Methylobacter psychrophilus]|uniref:hypothetical protein n=1 Tax=Methylobacter psychrophilus TaxID=96941 RepID=UPI0021D4C054|nr:hypothetical protein [Methylobacter psychrophilus]
MSNNPDYDPELYYRSQRNNMESKLKADGEPDSPIDEALFIIECLALRIGHKSYLQDVNNRLIKYLEAGLPLPPGLNQHLVTQLKCISNGEDANNVFNIIGGKGTKVSHALRNREIYDFLKRLDRKEYSLNGSRKKKSAFEYAAKYFCTSEGTVKKAYERESMSLQLTKSIQDKLNKKNETMVLSIIINEFKHYQAEGGSMLLIDFAEQRLGLINRT